MSVTATEKAVFSFPTDPSTSPALFKLLRVTEKCRELATNMEAQTLQCLLLVAVKPGIRQAELVELVGLAPSSVSRNVAMLSEIFRPGIPGLGLVHSYIDPNNRRNRIIELTEKGKAFLREIEQIISR